MDYKSKYIKYKSKYLNLQFGSAPPEQQSEQTH